MMMNRTRALRIAVSTLVFSVAMGFGAFQVVANDGTNPRDTQASCNAWACRQECGSLGGNLGPGGPGKPLKCYCCG